MSKYILPIINLLIVIVCAVQMPLSTIPLRLPASWGRSLSIEQIRAEIENYRTVVNGKDIECNDVSLSEEEQGNTAAAAEIDKLISPEIRQYTQIADVPREESSISACEELGYRFDDENNEVVEGCTPRHERGLIDIVAFQTMLDEKAEKSSKILTVQDKMLRSLHEKGLLIRSEVLKVLKNDDLDIDERRELLQDYLGGVLISFRDFLVIRRSYLPHEYGGDYFVESLIPEFPTDLIPDGESYSDSIIAGKILMGPNPQTSPWNLKHVPKMWGSSTIQFDSLGVLNRDIVTLLKAPSKQNYVRALKWMNLQMMLGQIQLYSSIHNDNKPIYIPRSCQGHFNGDLPETFNLSVREGEGDRIVENLLVNAGLSLSVDPNSSDDIAEKSSRFIEYFINSVDTNPLKDGYSGLMPFESYKNARIGVQQAKGTFFFDHKLEPGIDDRTDFEYVVNEKGQEAMAVFKDTEDGKVISYDGFEIFQKILQQPNPNELYAIETENGDVVEIDSTSQNLSQFMLERMQRLGVTYYQLAIPEPVKNRLSQNTIKIDLPPLYGPQALRHWGLQLLVNATDIAVQNNDKKFQYFLVNACHSTGNKPEFCKQRKYSPEQLTKNLQQFLSDFRDPDKFVPLTRFYEERFNAAYPALMELWVKLRDKTNMLSEATVDEFTFIIDQLETGNEWARLRLGYLVALYELSSQVRTGATIRQYNREQKCEYRNISVKIGRLNKAAKKLMLNKQLNLFHANRLLSKKEKILFWQKQIGETNKGNSDLFQTIFENGADLYSRMEALSYKTLLSKDATFDYADQKMSDIDTDDYTSLVETISESDVATYANFFEELFKFKGTVDDKLDFYSGNAPDEFVDDPEYAKLSFLMIDNSYKQALYRAMIREASRIKKRKLIEKLDEFCSLEPTDYRNFKRIFYSTTRAQNYVNQLAGIPGVPEAVLEKVEGMSPEESQDLMIGMAQMGLMVAASTLGGACTVVSGGLCAPIGVAVTATSYALLASQIEIFRREFIRKIEADEDKAFIGEYSSIGLSDLSSVDKMHKSWFFTIFEAVSTITFVGTVARGVQVGTKLTKESAKAVLKHTSKESFSKIAKAVVHQSDTYLAESVLNYTNVKKSTTAMKKALKKPLSALALFKRGKIGKDALVKAFTNAAKEFTKPVSNVLLDSGDFLRSANAVNRRTANVVSTYWNNDPKQFARFLSSYNRKIQRGRKAMEAMKNKEGILYKIPVVGWAKGKIQGMRYENLVKYSDDILRIEKEANSASDLSSVISKNMDQLTDIFTKTGFRKREIPYMTLLQGGPHLGGISGGKRIPFIYAGADAFMMKKFFSARGVLAYDAYKTSAKIKLGLPLITNIADTTSDAVAAFQTSLRGAISKVSKTEKNVFLRKYVKLEGEMVNQIYSYLQESGQTKCKAYSKKELRSIIFKPSTLEERALGTTILNTVPAEKIFGMKDISDISYRAAKELSTGPNSSIDQFEDFLQALKVLSIQREITPVDYM